MKTWIISIAVILVTGSAAFLYYVYDSAREPLNERKSDAVDVAEQHVDISSVEEVTHYHGGQAYQVIDAVNGDGEEIYIWVRESEDEEPDIEVRRHSEGLTKEEVTELAFDELNISRLKSVRLGMTGTTPVYEITYEDDSDRQSYYYVRFEDGTYIRHYQFNS